MPKLKLTNPTITNLVTTKRIDYYDTIETGLIFRVTPSGGKTFALRYRNLAGEQSRITLGEYSATFTLANARDKVRDIKRDLAQGIDPKTEIAKRRSEATEAERYRFTFAQLARDFIARHLPTLRPKTSTEYRRIIQNILIPEFGTRAVESIRRRDVFALHERIGIDERKPTTANLTKAIASKMFSFAIEREYIESNPATNVKLHKAGKIRRDRAYTSDELVRIWNAFEVQQEPMRTYFKFLVLTCQRRTETLMARWDNIDLQRGTWTIPATDTKNKLEHVLPLSSQAVEILTEIHMLTGRSEYVFESTVKKGGPINWTHKAVDRVKELAGVADFRLHDLRRTGATYMAELGVERTVLGKVLNHKGIAQDHSVTAIYDRSRYSDEVRRALQRWAFRLEGIVTEQNDHARITKIA